MRVVSLFLQLLFSNSYLKLAFRCVLFHRRVKEKVMSTQTLNILYRTRQVGIRALFHPVPQPQRVQSKLVSLVSFELY